NNLINIYGKKNTFPTLFDLSEVSELDFRNNCRLGYRAKYLSMIINTFIQLSTLSNEDLPSKIPGLGPYGMAHIKVLNEDFSTIPIDSEVRAYCSEKYNLQTDQDIS